MKFAILVSSLFIASAHADDKMKDADFAKMKEEKLAHYDKRIANLQEAKGCVQAATKVEEIKACNKNMKGKMKELHVERKRKMKSWAEQDKLGKPKPTDKVRKQ